jgi:hypothetical protein
VEPIWACRSRRRGDDGIFDFAFDLPNELVSPFPMVLIPVFLVPVSVLLHLASLTKLRRGALCDKPSRNGTRTGVIPLLAPQRLDS